MSLDDYDRALLAGALRKLGRLSPRPYWCGDVPIHDNFGMPIGNVFVDGATIAGPWALMSPASYRVHGRGLGLGRGQCYVRENDGRYYKQPTSYVVPVR